MARTGLEPLGSMGTDAVLSARPRMLFDYFQQLFAQVTNPAAGRYSRGGGHQFVGHPRPGKQPAASDAQSCHDPAARSRLPSSGTSSWPSWSIWPTMAPTATGDGYAPRSSSCLYRWPRAYSGLRRARRHPHRASKAIAGGAIASRSLSDRESDATMAPIPSLLTVSAVHHHLVGSAPVPRLDWSSNPVMPRVHHMAC